ncbi:uncharacterized protein MONOS_7851 [Monocercomonoides exilis]|uniref:uncharacterized protein n=1 Tax=Monocercomonoides exilis TaxID=2049356 RepID=UPI0035596D24|nr:hypothetical protein MONOS_7851 [Monocercomonoides exilis]|eukprot:MONOS_7851.1-p1 / transcript=MONOS_7851.1 / gene=MONOS_7851 / organism=Monocercomonoides_exilis_PA203 / gene_product=unspecified product / transcript_product=unspecified product / location=Mono_scaffold00280:17426-17923(+) / protein_length=124 / sequence_SO=supercontig / SO=protein_coding / is_pseudo=false
MKNNSSSQQNNHKKQIITFFMISFLFVLFTSRQVLPKKFYKKFRYEIRIIKNFVLSLPTAVIAVVIMVYTGFVLMNKSITPPPTSFDIVKEDRYHQNINGNAESKALSEDNCYTIREVNSILYD